MSMLMPFHLEAASRGLYNQESAVRIDGYTSPRHPYFQSNTVMQYDGLVIVGYSQAQARLKAKKPTAKVTPPADEEQWQALSEWIGDELLSLPLYISRRALRVLAQRKTNSEEQASALRLRIWEMAYACENAFYAQRPGVKRIRFFLPKAFHHDARAGAFTATRSKGSNGQQRILIDTQ